MLWFATMLLILPVITAGSLLPTWMFINSLQIIAHMVLLKTVMPGTVHYFLNKYLDWLRWYESDFVAWLRDAFEFKQYDVDFGAYHALLQACSYEHLLGQNLILIFAFLLLCFAISAVLLIKDLVVAWQKKDKDATKKDMRQK